MKNRDEMKKPDWMNDEEWAWFKERTASVELIVSDAKADVQAYLASPAGRPSRTGRGLEARSPVLVEDERPDPDRVRDHVRAVPEGHLS